MRMGDLNMLKQDNNFVFGNSLAILYVCDAMYMCFLLELKFNSHTIPGKYLYVCMCICNR